MGSSPYDYDENGNPEILGQSVSISNEVYYCYAMLACTITIAIVLSFL